TVTIYDVAREAKVSMATVSRVLNGNPNVKPETRKKVKEVIKRLNYRPNAVARGLASKKTTTVGVIIPDISICIIHLWQEDWMTLPKCITIRQSLQIRIMIRKRKEIHF